MNPLQIQFLVGAARYFARLKAARRKALCPGVAAVRPLSFLRLVAADSKAAFQFYLFVALSRCTHLEGQVTSQATARVPVLWLKPATTIPISSCARMVLVLTFTQPSSHHTRRLASFVRRR